MSGFRVDVADILTSPKKKTNAGAGGNDEDVDEEIDLVTLVNNQDALAAEAREVLPYKSDECTYAMGPIRQSVFSCLDCGERGVCYGCSIRCHAEHRLVELWTKRGFTCDCPTEPMATTTASSSTSSSGSRVPRKCALNPADEQPYPSNEDKNRYTHNFAGKFCRCGRDYDPMTEPEAMVHCIGCEDWFHESCLNLQPRRIDFADYDEDEDEDEEANCLIPSETYDGMVCAKCVASHPFLVEKRGTPGWMTIVPEGEQFVVVGKLEKEKQKEASAEGEKEQEKATEVAAEDINDKGITVDSTNPPVDAEADTRRKRVLADDSAPDVPGAKRARVEEAEDEGESRDPAPPPPAAPVLKAAGDVFIAHGIREALAETLAENVASTLPFPLVDAEIYEPAEDDSDDETLDQVTERILGSLPRVQAIEAAHGYQLMKEKLEVMLAAHAEAGKTVTREDIEEFFAGLRQGK